MARVARTSACTGRVIEVARRTARTIAATKVSTSVIVRIARAWSNRRRAAAARSSDRREACTAISSVRRKSSAARVAASSFSFPIRSMFAEAVM